MPILLSILAKFQELSFPVISFLLFPLQGFYIFTVYPLFFSLLLAYLYPIALFTLLLLQFVSSVHPHVISPNPAFPCPVSIQCPFPASALELYARTHHAPILPVLAVAFPFPMPATALRPTSLH